MSYRIGVDVGGTFTDFTIIDGSGNLTLWKEATNPAAPTRAIADGLEAVAKVLGKSAEQLIAETSLFVHGTTIATNALIQRNGPKIGLLCTEGFRDILYLRDGFKPNRYDVHMEHPGTFVDRYLRVGIPGRITRDGSELAPLDEDAVRSAARMMKAEGVESVAVAFLWSIMNPAHEQRAREILQQELPKASLVCSVDVLPEIREWERTSAAVLSAYILPGVKDYLAELERLLERLNFARKPLIMQINGGCNSVADILRRPVNLLASGPAAAPAAAAALVQDQSEKNVITIDMGGTSLDVCLLRNGRAAMSRNVQVEDQPIGVPAVEVRSIGAGGGSIAWVDSGGALRVGPRSAGATPGPAAYGAGGTEPTVTDANVVLGLLDPDAFLGGRRRLERDLARAAVKGRVGDVLGLNETDAAAGIIRVVNANMVSAIRGVSIERGIDPRGFTLVAGGGAGGLHAVGLARELGMRDVLIPREAGTLCSYGMTVTEIRLDETFTGHALQNSVNVAQIDGQFAEAEARVRARLAQNGLGEDEIVIERQVDARYPGQVHELTIALRGASGGGQFTVADHIDQIGADFHEEHRRTFTYARNELQVEFLHWRVIGIGRVSYSAGSGDAAGAGAGAAGAAGSRRAYSLQRGAMTEMAVYDGERLAPGVRLTGPALLDSSTTTILLDDGDELNVRPDGGFQISVSLG